ncbi:MAG: hypothetical protein CMH59_06175 [Myxococcales bacterium]|nr:hypothetical protein [Myxococcales bacterium]
MPRFLAPLLLASFALGATAPASAQDGPDEPLVLLMVSRTDAVDETAVVDALGREGVQAVTLEHPRAPYLDAIVLLVEEDGRRAMAFVRGARGIELRMLRAGAGASPTDTGRWIAAPLAAFIRAEWRPAPLREAWASSQSCAEPAPNDFIARVRDGVVDPWAFVVVAEQIDAPAIADPWR